MKPVETQAHLPLHAKFSAHAHFGQPMWQQPRIQIRHAMGSGEQVRLLGVIADHMRGRADLPGALDRALDAIRQAMAIETIQLIRVEGSRVRRLAMSGSEWNLEGAESALPSFNRLGSAGPDRGTSAQNAHWITLSAVGTTRWLLGIRYPSRIAAGQGDMELLRAAGSILAGSLDRLQLLSDLRASEEGALRALAAALASRDRYTGQHVDAVSLYAERLAQQIGLAGEALLALQTGSILHDIGKIGVSDAILQKNGPLTEYEMMQMRQHTVIGAQIVRHIQRLERAIPIILYHHERWDGGGYPSGLAGEQIPLGARIVAVVDSYDAITSTRPYRKARSEAEALQVLRDGRGTYYDPHLADAFLKLMS